MSAQPFSDPHIFEVNRSQVDYHGSSRSLTFSDSDGLHTFYSDYRPDYIPVTLFVRDGADVRAMVAWSHPTLVRESDF